MSSLNAEGDTRPDQKGNLRCTRGRLGHHRGTGCRTSGTRTQLLTRTSAPGGWPRRDLTGRLGRPSTTPGLMFLTIGSLGGAGLAPAIRGLCRGPRSTLSPPRPAQCGLFQVPKRPGGHWSSRCLLLTPELGHKAIIRGPRRSGGRRLRFLAPPHLLSAPSLACNPLLFFPILFLFSPSLPLVQSPIHRPLITILGHRRKGLPEVKPALCTSQGKEISRKRGQRRRRLDQQRMTLTKAIYPGEGRMGIAGGASGALVPRASRILLISASPDRVPDDIRVP